MCALALLAALVGCAGSASSGEDQDIQWMLDTRAAAVRERDAGAFLATVDPAEEGFRDGQRRMFANLADVPLSDWGYQLLRTDAFTPPGGAVRRVAAEVRLTYRLAGYDTSPVKAVQYLTLVHRGGHWRVASDTDGAAEGRRTARQLWDQGAVEVVRGRHSVVLGTGGDRAALRELADRTDRAVPAVEAAWPGGWPGKVVVLAPSSVEGMARLLDADAAGYQGIAAVTTGETGGSARAPAARVIVNPEAYEQLSDIGRQIVLTHETTHVATRTVTTTATPLWLSEGFADWAAYRTTDRTPATAAPELASAHALGSAPRELPSAEDFHFSGDARRLARAYESGWLACRMIADRWGEAKLVDYYRAVAREGSVERATASELGVSMAEFTRRWRAYMAEELG